MLKVSSDGTHLEHVFDETSTPKTKKKRRGKNNNNNNNNLELRSIQPITENQRKVFEHYKNDMNLVLHGSAGTGKTFVALYLALKEVLDPSNEKNRVYIIRSATQSKDMGFMPGNLKQKMAEYENPYRSACRELFGRGDAYDILKQKGIIEFCSTSFLRGETFADAVVIVDEIQNAEFREIHTVMTRIGDNSRIILSGDIKQNDLYKKNEVSGLPKAFELIRRMDDCFAVVEFTIDDIVRSGLVKRWCEELDKAS
mgnify:FL=1